MEGAYVALPVGLERWGAALGGHATCRASAGSSMDV